MTYFFVPTPRQNGQHSRKTQLTLRDAEKLGDDLNNPKLLFINAVLVTAQAPWLELQWTSGGDGSAKTGFTVCVSCGPVLGLASVSRHRLCGLEPPQA